MMTDDACRTVAKNHPKNSFWFWLSLIGLIALTFLTQLAFIFSTTPAEVMQGVESVQDKVDRLERTIRMRTGERLYRAEFEDFLLQNPQLKPPRIRMEILSDNDVVIKENTFGIQPQNEVK